MKLSTLNKRVTRFAALSTLLLGLSACAEINSVGKFAWTQTENAAELIYSPVASLLRETPEQAPDFETLDAVPEIDETDKKILMAALRGSQDVQDVEFEIFETQTVFVLSANSLENTLSSDAIYGKIEKSGDKAVTVPDIRFYKAKGKSDVEDWFDCEAEAEGYMLWTGKGYSADPKFADCMSALGYKSGTYTPASDAI
jgi:hypothetical protein